MAKRGHESDSEQQLKEEDNQIYDNPDDLKGIAVTKEQLSLSRAKLFKSSKNQDQRLIIVLEQANLEIVKIGKNFELLNCDDHMTQIRKYKKDPAFCRPDITHQVSHSLKNSFFMLINYFLFHSVCLCYLIVH